MWQSFIGAVVGAGINLRDSAAGQIVVRPAAVEIAARTRKLFSPKRPCILPDREIPYEELFYRKSDVIVLHARTVELVDRGYQDVMVRLAPGRLLEIGGEKIESRRRAVSGGGQRGNRAAARGDGLGRREIHGRHRRVHRLAGRDVFADDQFDDWRGGGRRRSSCCAGANGHRGCPTGLTSRWRRRSGFSAERNWCRGFSRCDFLTKVGKTGVATR